MYDHPFPAPIRRLTLAYIPLPGITAYLSQGEDHQIIFMHFAEEVVLPERTSVDFLLSGA